MPAVTQVNSIRPRYALGVVRSPEILKPTPITKQRADAVIGLPGVVGDSGHRKISRGIWETHLASTRDRVSQRDNLARESITWPGLSWESDGGIVAEKPGNAGGAKAL